jgi:hypothetical protein
MAIKVQKFVIDEAVLDLIGNEFKFDHSKGLAEWLKNSSDAYLRERVPDDDQFMIIRLTEDSRGQLIRVECIDFVGMNKKQIDDAFKRFFDPQAAKKGAKDAHIKTLGGHGNGGKFYMRQMFKTAQAITFRNGKLNIFGFNAKRQYGFEEGFEDRPMSLQEAMRKANVDKIALEDDVKSGLSAGDFGFTVVRGENPYKVKGTTNRDKLVEKLVFHPQARRLIDRKPVTILFGNETKPTRLTAPNLVPKEGFEQAVVIQIPASLEWEGKAVPFKTEAYDWPGRLVLKTSNEPLRGNLATLNAIDFIGEVGVIATYRIHELGGTRFSGQSEFLYGECECSVLEDPDNDCVRNDRQKLLENERSSSLIEWVREQVEELAEKMEVKNVQEKKKRDLKNTSAFNEMLNRWKNRFMGQIWAEVFVGKGPAGSAGVEPGGGPSGRGDGGDGGTGSGAGSGQEGGSETKRKPRFPLVLISSQDNDPLDPLSAEPFHCDPRHPAIYRRRKDVEVGIYWINTSRPLADKIIKEYTSDSTRWREYLFQRYVDIIIKESIYQLGKIETSLSPDEIDRCIDDVTTRLHDHAAKDLNAFLFEEQFGLN